MHTANKKAESKVIIRHKSHGEVSLVEQDTIDYVYTAYFEPKKKIFCFIKEILRNFLGRMLQYLKKMTTKT